jgi:hypothetical protein
MQDKTKTDQPGAQKTTDFTDFTDGEKEKVPAKDRPSPKRFRLRQSASARQDGAARRGKPQI